MFLSCPSRSPAQIGIRIYVYKFSIHRRMCACVSVCVCVVLVKVAVKGRVMTAHAIFYRQRQSCQRYVNTHMVSDTRSHCTVTEPSVSTAGSFLTMVLFFAKRVMASASEMVTTAGKPSGMIATAIATADLNAVPVSCVQMKRQVMLCYAI